MGLDLKNFSRVNSAWLRASMKLSGKIDRVYDFHFSRSYLGPSTEFDVRLTAAETL